MKTRVFDIQVAVMIAKSESKRLAEVRETASPWITWANCLQAYGWKNTVTDCATVREWCSRFVWDFEPLQGEGVTRVDAERR